MKIAVTLPTVFLAVWLAAGCSTVPTPRSGHLVPLAERFMADYARDLSSGDRLAVAARYHPQGSYVLGNGRKSFVTSDATLAYYRGQWKPPATFEWEDLSFEPVGDAGVLVLGRFRWGDAGNPEPTTYSYSGLLVPVNGQLRIRSEDESTAAK